MSFGQEMFRVDRLYRHRKCFGQFLQLDIQTVLVGQKIVEPCKILLLNEVNNIFVDGLAIFAIVELHINDPMPAPAEPLRKGAHGRKKGRHLLNVVFDIVCLLADFHQDVGNIPIDLFEPGMIFIQLITKDQTENFLTRHVVQSSDQLDPKLENYFYDASRSFRRYILR